MPILEPDLRSAGRTDAGLVRRQNEDALLLRPEIGLWAVADGMGGHSRGDWASGRVMERLAQVPSPATAPDLNRDVHDAILAAHDDIRQAGEQAGQGIIGCTVVALTIFGRQFCCLWAGDSRLYRLRDGTLTQLSRDHSRVQDLVDMGLLSENAAHGHPQANMITRAVGVGALELDTCHDALEDGDLLLLCTDGVNKMLADTDIAGCLAGRDPETGVADLVEQALARGGRDNVTAILVQYQSAAASAPPPEPDQAPPPTAGDDEVTVEHKIRPAPVPPSGTPRDSKERP